VYHPPFTKKYTTNAHFISIFRSIAIGIKRAVKINTCTMATRSIISKSIGESSSTYKGVAGELILDTSTNTLKISDGSTGGGITLTTDGSGSGSTGDIGFSGNTISTSSTNANLELDASGTGSVVIKPGTNLVTDTLTITDSDFVGYETKVEFTNELFKFTNTINNSHSWPTVQGMLVDYTVDNFYATTTSNVGSSDITHWTFDKKILSGSTVATRSGVLRFEADNADTTVRMAYHPSVSTESNKFTFANDGLALAGTVNKITIGGTVWSTPRRISFTTDTNSGGTSAGDGPHCGITDDTATETVLITNHQGSTGSRCTLKASGGNLATGSAGKIVTVQCVSGSNVSVDFYRDGGYQGVTLGSNTMETFFWTGTDWKRLTA
jgi:hypothetical protein